MVWMHLIALKFGKMVNDVLSGYFKTQSFQEITTEAVRRKKVKHLLHFRDIYQ